MTKAQERQAVFGFGIVFIIVMLVIAIVIPRPGQFAYLVFRTVLALAAGGIVAFMPGFIDLSLGKWLKAGGALAAFVLVFKWDPPRLLVPSPQLFTVRVKPDTISLFPNAHYAVEYQFKGTPAAAISIESRDVYWLMDDGNILESSTDNRMPDGPFVVPTTGTYELTDDIGLPQVIINRVQQLGNDQIKLKTIFHGKSAEGIEVIAKAMLTIRLQIPSEVKKQVENSLTKEIIPTKPIPPVGLSFPISGYVQDAEEQNMLANVSVRADGKSVLTDSTGYFKLMVAGDSGSTKLVQITRAGYEPSARKYTIPLTSKRFLLTKQQ